MALRLVIYLQIVWILIVGLICRGVLPEPETRWFDVLFVGALYCFPAAVLAALDHSELPRTRKRWILAAEVGLTIAYIIATFPAIQ